MMKRKLAILSAMALCLSSVPISVSASSNSTTTEKAVPLVAENTIKGDVNADGKFTVADVVMLQKWLLGTPEAPLSNWKTADLCEDGELNVFDLCMMKKELIQQTPPASISYSFNTYTELSEAISKPDYFANTEMGNNENLFHKTVSAFENNEFDLYIPVANGTVLPLRNSDSTSNVTLMTSELYNLPWIWYRCNVNDCDVDIKLAYPSVVESNKLDSVKTYYEVLKMIAPNAPNPDNYTEFESYQNIYEADINLANDKKVVAMISEIKDSNKVYVMFFYDDVMVSVYADKEIISDDFWSEFSLMNYEQIEESDTVIIQTPPASNTYTFNSYNELADAVIKSDSFTNDEFSDYGDLFYKTISGFEKNEITLYIPATNGEACVLRNRAITLMTSELYNLPWIWYRCNVNDSDIDIKLAYPLVVESDKLNSATTYYEVLKMIAPNAPNPDNYTEFESYQSIYEAEINLANNKNVVAMISEIKDSSKVYVMFIYDGVLVSIYTDKNNMSEEFWNSFSLTEY